MILTQTTTHGHVDLPTVKTASWFTKLPADHVQVGISRGVPRGTRAGYRRYPALNPGGWFKSCTIPQYLERYNAILGVLDPAKVVRELEDLAGAGSVPTLLCFESAGQCAAGAVWCHRHLVSQWLEDRLGIVVEEVGHPTLDRFALLRNVGIAQPRYGA